MAFSHGITITEINEGARPLVTVATSVIGVVVTAPAADADLFPLDRPALVLDLDAAIGKAGATGTLRPTLRAIADQVKTPVIVVRVAPGQDADDTDAAVIGDTVNGLKTGMQALLAAEAQLGLRPRILAAPGLDTKPVATALAVIAKRLRAMAYCAANGATLADVLDYRKNFSSRELMLIHPDFVAFDTASAGNVTSWATARAVGLRAKLDQEQGWHKSLSNVEVAGVVGLTRDIQFDYQDQACEANLLNAAQITALVRPNGGGYRFWGNRTAVELNDPFSFEVATRSAQVIMDTIAAGMLWAIDKPLRPSLAKDIVETINGTLRQFVLEGRLLGGTAWYNTELNTIDGLKTGKLVIDYDFTPVPPLENLALQQRITDRYFADFGAGLGVTNAAA